MPTPQRLVEKSSGRFGRRAHEARHDEGRRQRLERHDPGVLCLIDQRLAAGIQTIEQKRRQRNLCPQTFHIQLPAEPLHRHLKGMWRAVKPKRDDTHRVDHFGNGGRDVTKVA